MVTLLGSDGLDPRLSWHCPPPRAEVQAETLVVETAANTDFWQRTHYGFQADNGHFLGLTLRGNFTLSAHVTFRPVHQYDQAGLMLRVSPDCWLKTSVEFEPDEAHDRLGAVVTNHGYSDWSTQPLDKSVRSLWLRVRAEARAVIVDRSCDGHAWEQLRMAHLAERSEYGDVVCGLYACSPKDAGFVAQFRHFELRAP
jgi:uncharacterized protein